MKIGQTKIMLLAHSGRMIIISDGVVEENNRHRHFRFDGFGDHIWFDKVSFIGECVTKYKQI